MIPTLNIQGDLKMSKTIKTKNTGFVPSVFNVTLSELPNKITTKEKSGKLTISFRDYNGWKYSINSTILEKDGDNYVLEVVERDYAVFLKAEDMDLGSLQSLNQNESKVKVVEVKSTASLDLPFKAINNTKKGETMATKNTTAPAVAVSKEELAALDAAKETIKITNNVDVEKETTVVSEATEEVVETIEETEDEKSDFEKGLEIINGFSTDPEAPVNQLENRQYPVDEVIKFLAVAKNFWDIPRIGACLPEEDLTKYVTDIVRDGSYNKVQVVALIQKELNSDGIFLEEPESTVNTAVEWVKENPVKAVGIAAAVAGLAYLGYRLFGGSDEVPSVGGSDE